VPRRLLGEGAHAGALAFERAEAAGRPDRSDGGLATMGAVESQQRGDVDVRNAVAIRHAERVVLAEVRRDPLEAPAGLRAVARVHQRDPPWLAARLVEGAFAAGQVD